MNILGVWDGHDSGAVLLVDGRLTAAINEERLTRRKLEVCFPERAIAACLAQASLPASAIDAVAASTTDAAKTLSRWLPSTKERDHRVRRRLASPSPITPAIRRARYRMTTWPPNSFTRALSSFVLRRTLDRVGIRAARTFLFDHHECHAWGAAHVTGRESATVLTVDGVGDGLSATASLFRNGRLQRLASSSAVHSVGVFLSTSRPCSTCASSRTRAK